MQSLPAEEISVADFRLDRVPPGTKQRFHLVVDRLPGGQPVIFPTLVARGRTAGKTFLVTGCVHGDEFEGPVATQDVFEELDVESMRGTFIGRR
jgi:predicted deacylase